MLLVFGAEYISIMNYYLLYKVHAQLHTLYILETSFSNKTFLCIASETYKHFSLLKTAINIRSTLTQEAAVINEESAELSPSQEPKHIERKKQVPIQELVESLKSTADDIGQISELSSEEKILIAQFFSSLLKLMQPLAPSIAVNQLALPAEVGDVVQAHVDPTGHLILQFEDGHVELKDLSEEKNRDLMTAVFRRRLAKI